MSSNADSSFGPLRRMTAFLRRYSIRPRATPVIEQRTEHVGANIVIFGETGAGKSSVINLIVGKNVAYTSNGACGCTFHYRQYPVKLNNVPYTLWDTMGLDGGSEATVAADEAEKNLRELIQMLAHAEGIHLVIYCIRGTRLTKTLKHYYRRFYVTLCRKKVPVALVVTYLEHQRGDMESWWVANEAVLLQNNMRFDAHVCVTTLNAADNVIQQRRKHSEELLRDLIAQYSMYPGWKANSNSARIMPFHNLSHAKGNTMIPHRVLVYDNPPNSSPEEPYKVKSIPPVPDLVSSSPLRLTLHAPDFPIDEAFLNPWKGGQLIQVEDLLTAAITGASGNTTHHLLVSRALVRTRLEKWDKALVDAEKVIEIRPCAIAYIAKSIALVGKGQREDGYRTCDIAFAPFHSTHVTFLLLIKAVIVFMAGEQLDAISRVDNLIATVHPDPTYHVVQSYMYLLWGKSRMDSSDYEGAIESFERARAQIRHDTSQALLLISLIFGWKFDNIGTMVRHCLCDAQISVGRTEDAVRSFHAHLDWEEEFKQRACKKLDVLGDAAVSTQRHREAISHYTASLSLHPPSPQVILLKRSKAFLGIGSWKQALDDANQVIKLDPLSPRGYEIKHAALHKAGDYEKAVHSLEAMLSKTEQPPDPSISLHGRRWYMSPSSIRTRICRIIERTLRDSPYVLINTITGHLCNRAERASAFKSLPIFNKLVSSKASGIDRVSIKQEVRQYFQYAMLSHKWEENEPSFEQVIRITVYDLGPSPTHNKLQMFCKIARRAGFNWAWSDTCCIDKGNHDVHQEALVAMFRWYHGSALMIVFLRGVRSASKRGALAASIWNTRGWTLQEYIAARVIHFYTEDWTPYLNLPLANHKESPEVISEMEQATGVPSEQLISLRPGLTSIREKLRLASTRRTERTEDAAYSLLGILSVTGIPAIYGEGDAALGRLLSQVLTVSLDVSILAWTGESGSFNSCLPSRITVFNGSATSYLPSPIPDNEMERTVSVSRGSSFDLDVALRLYDRLKELPSSSFAANRMKLPCISFPLPSLSSNRARSGRVYHADTVPFGRVDIKTRQDLSRMQSLYLVHPWLDSLLGQAHTESGSFVGGDVVPSYPARVDEEIPDDEFEDESSPEDPEPELEPGSRRTPVHAAPVDRETQARRLAARLRQPFGALLVTSESVETGRRVLDYRRVTADGLITVAFQDNVSLGDILGNVRTLDVL